MLTRSNAAIFVFCRGGVFVVAATSGSELPKRRLSLMIRHVILSGSFFDVGVKKLDTAFSKDRISSVNSRKMHSTHLLVVVDSTLGLFNGGGDKDASLAFAFLFEARSAFIVLITSAGQ